LALRLEARQQGRVIMNAFHDLERNTAADWLALFGEVDQAHAALAKYA
jgi:hypothetical protein